MFDIFNGCSSSIKEINRVIWRGLSKIYIYWHSQSFDFLRKKIWRNALALKSKKIYKVYSGKRLDWYCHLQMSFVYKTVSQISLKLFCSGDKRPLSEFLRKEFVDEKAIISTTLIYSCHWKTYKLFCL